MNANRPCLRSDPLDRYLIWTVIKPSHMLVWLALLGVVTYRRSSGRRLLLLAACVLVVVTLLPVGAWLTAPLEQRFTAPPDGAVPDGIVVLAGAEAAALTSDYGDAQWHEGADRLTTFVMLAHRFPEARLIHSGSGKAKRPGDLSQSAVARAFVLGTGIDPARVVFEDQSTDTCNSPAAVIATAALTGEQWWLVTSAFHMPRAIACYRAAGWNLLPYPTDYRYTKTVGLWPPDLSTNLGNIDLALHEWLGLVYYRLTGRTQELFPGPATPDP